MTHEEFKTLSHKQTLNERNAVQQHRRSDLRIRSFDWLLEKPGHYSAHEITLFEKIAQIANFRTPIGI